MADTITYDPSEDPQAIAEAEARDGESLAVGEKMEQEQSNLLAGKYKDAEDLEKAYIELQSKLGEGTDSTTPSNDDMVDIPEGYESGYDDDGYVNWDAVNETYGEKISNVFKEAEVDPWEISSHFHANNGQITADMNKSLLDAGFSQASVDAYLSGRARESGYTGGYTENLTDSDVSDLMSLAGGKSQYNAMTDWASKNLSQDDINAFDEVTNTGNKAAVRFAIKAMHGQYEDAVGRTPELVTGKSPQRGQTYRSMAEVVRDMESPRYEKDEAYRFDVMQKLERSNLKV